METDQLIKENQELKAKLIEIERRQKSDVVESLVALNKDLIKSDLMEESMETLKLRKVYEQKLVEASAAIEEAKKHPKTAGVVEAGKSTNVNESADEGFIVESDGMSMTEKTYNDLRKEIRESIYI